MSEKVRNFKELRVWQQAIELVQAVYDIVKMLPKTETYALGDQLRRAAVSVPANIAEGQARLHTKEFVQFLGVARGSLAETETLLIVAHRLGYVTSDQLGKLETRITELRRPLQALTGRLRQRMRE